MTQGRVHQEAGHPPATRRVHTVRQRLVLLVLAVLLPTSAISLIAAYTIYTEALRSLTTVALETARALSLVADRELAYRAGILRTLATSPALERGDLQAFYDQARAVAPTFDTSVILSTPDGQQLLNTRVPYGTTSLPPIPVPRPDAGQLLDAATVSDLFMSQVAKQYSFAVTVPVMRNGELRWRVSMGSFASQVQRIFDQQRLPATWTGTLLDSRGLVVARSMDPDKSRGRSASPDMLARLATDTAGMLEAVTLDGTPVITVFSRAPESRWSVLIGVPRAEIRRGALNALGAMLGISLTLTALAVWAAMRVGRTIAEPVARLQSDAEALGQGKVVAESPTGLAETDAVQRLLVQASHDLRGADAKLQQEVREAVAAAEEAQRTALAAQKLEALGRLTGGIAHDFNNLLQAMMSGVQLAARLASDDRARKALATCDRAIARAVKLTRQLMSFGLAQPGHFETIDLRLQLDALRELLRGALLDAVPVRMEVAPDIRTVKVDPVQLELAILNLSLNARDAMSGHGEIRIDAGNRRLAAGEVPGLPEGDYVSIGVTDTGHGIPPALMGRVFEPFFTTKPAGKGTGLGLAQVYAFAKQAGGAAHVESELEVGTCVRLLLPAATDAAGMSPDSAPPPQDPRYHGGVLLVEDNALVRGITAEMLESAGYTVMVASSAEDALAIVAARRDVDVVLSDVVMPGRSGIELMQALKLSHPGLPVVLASGYAQALAVDVEVQVIAKPFDPRELARVLARHIAGRTGSETAGG